MPREVLSDRNRLLTRALTGRTRDYRVRWILALDEAARLGRAATWDEWNAIWFRRTPWTEASALQALNRLKRELKALGVVLPSSRRHFVDARAPEVRALVSQWHHCARRTEIRLEAERQGTKPDYTTLRRQAKGLRAAQVAEELRGSLKNLVIESKQALPAMDFLRRKLGIGYERLRYLLSVSKQPVRAPNRRRKIEDVRPEDLLELALAVFDVGGRVCDVKAILACSRRTAWLFLKRHGRETGRQRARVALPRERSERARPDENGATA